MGVLGGSDWTDCARVGVDSPFYFVVADKGKAINGASRRSGLDLSDCGRPTYQTAS